MRHSIIVFFFGLLMLVSMSQGEAKDYWVHSDADIHVYCDSDSVQRDSDGNYYDVTAKTIATDGTYLGRQEWRFNRQNGVWYFWHSGMDEDISPLYTSSQDQESRVGRSILAWLKKYSQ